MVVVIDDDTEPAETNHLVELVAALVDGAVVGHEGSNLPAPRVHVLGKVAAQVRHGRRGEIRGYLLRYEKDFFSCHFIQFRLRATPSRGVAMDDCPCLPAC